MELAFRTAELREICEKRAVATEKLGYAAARELADRLADIEAVETVTELSALLGSALQSRSESEKALLLETGTSVLFGSGHPARSDQQAKAIDWSKTTRIKILDIEPDNG